MAIDSELVERLQELLRTSDLNTTTTNAVRRQLEKDFGIDLSERKAFIRKQIEQFLETHLVKPQNDDVEAEIGQDKGQKELENVKNENGSELKEEPEEEIEEEEDDDEKQNLVQDESENVKKEKSNGNRSQEKKDPKEEQMEEEEDNDDDEGEEEEKQNLLQEEPKNVKKEEGHGNRFEEEEDPEEEEMEEEDNDDDDDEGEEEEEKQKLVKEDKDVKKRGGGYTKPCSLSPKLQEFVGVPELARTEVVKKIWAYIKEKNLQNPKNKRKILCDETLHALFRVKSIDMFKMNRELSKHIWPIEDCAPVKSSKKEKRSKWDKEGSDDSKLKAKRQKGEGSGVLAPLQLSDALVKFIGTGENALSWADVVKRMWQYIKQNNLQDPSDKRRIICDKKLKELFDVDTFTGLAVSKLLAAHIVKAR